MYIWKFLGLLLLSIFMHRGMQKLDHFEFVGLLDVVVTLLYVVEISKSF